MAAPQIRSRFLAQAPLGADALTAGVGKGAAYKFVASDADYDRYDDRIGMKGGKPVAGLGWQLDNFNANPVILYAHDDASGDSKALPVGTGRAYLEKDAAGVERLMVDVVFDPEDTFALAVERKVAKRLLNAVSVRYLISPDGYEINDRGGIDSWEQELLEISVVVIPGNQRALRVKALDAEAFRAEREAAKAPPAPKFTEVDYRKAFAEAFAAEEK